MKHVGEKLYIPGVIKEVILTTETGNQSVDVLNITHISTNYTCRVSSDALTCPRG